MRQVMNIKTGKITVNRPHWIGGLFYYLPVNKQHLVLPFIATNKTSG